ncbi:MAG: DNA mismatch repair endonuclease MutL, partial [Kofleriaceae bacterium]
MEPVIAVLPSHVIDQIAAGEVIERPASVVKELVDNALDAGARTITVETTAGGRGLVRVSDDGCGMAPNDALLAFERHATSKLRVADDLWGIATMGFRGEALPSIASVSRLTLTTRRERDLAATRVRIETGRVVGVTEVGAPVGTTIEVADLLANLPARLKFLKGEATEASHITELVGKLAMAYPSLHFRLRHNGRTALELPPDRDGLARVHALLGARIASRMVPVTGEEEGVRVTAYLGPPELAQTTARGVQLFVGKRPVRDRGLLHAVAMGYGELVPRGRYPVVVVMLDVPAGAVDINVHPQKVEVRFSDAAAVTAAVRHVVQAGIAAAPWRAESAAAPVHVIASLAPPPLPFDGQAATPLAQRYARELRQRGSIGAAGQGALALDTTPPAAVPGRTGTSGASGAFGASGASSASGAFGVPGTSGAPRAAESPRAWVAQLRAQTQAE